MKHKIAGITIGQSPRTDITNDIYPLLSPSIELVEYGALDNFSNEELNKSVAISDEDILKNPDDSVLVSRLNNGGHIRFFESSAFPLIQNCLSRASADGCHAAILFCTGNFPPFSGTLPIIIPRPIVYSLMHCVFPNSRIAIIVPEKEQAIEMQKPKTNKFGLVESNLVYGAASPYKDPFKVIETAQDMLEKYNPDLFYLDCMGYGMDIKQAIQNACNTPVLLPRTVIASLINELYGT